MQQIARQVHDLIVVPTLKEVEMYTPAAAKLITYTAAVESGFGYLKQLNGPAVGWWEMQSNAYEQCVSYLNRDTSVMAGHKKLILTACGLSVMPPFETMIWNLRFAMCMARVQYWQCEDKMPEANDLKGLGEYYIKLYNRGGKATIERFIAVCDGLLPNE